MPKKNIYFSITLIAILVIFCFFILQNGNQGDRTSTWKPDLQVNKVLPQKLAKNKINYVKIAGKLLKVDLATTTREQEQGLSGRKDLADDAGMLFIFQKPSVNYFWMKDMNFPIDMVWIDENFQVVYIEKNAKPESYPKTFGPNKNSKYVLEVQARFSEKNNLKVGEKIEFLP